MLLEVVVLPVRYRNQSNKQTETRDAVFHSSDRISGITYRTSRGYWFYTIPPEIMRSNY